MCYSWSLLSFPNLLPTNSFVKHFSSMGQYSFVTSFFLLNCDIIYWCQNALSFSQNWSRYSFQVSWCLCCLGNECLTSPQNPAIKWTAWSTKSFLSHHPPQPAQQLNCGHLLSADKEITPQLLIVITAPVWLYISLWTANATSTYKRIVWVLFASIMRASSTVSFR